MRPFLLRMLWLSAALGLGGCIDRYTPDVPPAAQASLVVDGFINPLGNSVIKLSRSFSINTKSTAPAEIRAQVAIQNEAGQRYPLAENPAGTYTSAALTLDPARQYQLRITTAQGRDYASDLAPVVPTPPIDSLSWQPTSQGGVQVYASTHAASTAARYYRWDYDETWQFTSAFYSKIEYRPSTNTVVGRPPERQLFVCWRTESSTAIVQGTTIELSQNALVRYPLFAVLPDVRLHYGYSVLVRQYAQAQAEYNYWERLRKNTENLGTINDPLPGRVTGNVHALADPNEVVLGYVGVHSVASRRLFIDVSTLPKPLPSSVFNDLFYANCVPPEVFFFPQGLPEFKSGQLIPLLPIINQKTLDTIGATASTSSCVDCRLRGTNNKPSFWP